MMSEDSWGAVEAFLRYYQMTHFVNASIKRETEFDTMWYAAETEGAKRTLTGFFAEMENEAGRVQT